MNEDALRALVRELFFEGRHFRPHHELAMGGYPRNRLVNFGAQPAALRGKIDKRNRRGIDSGVFVHLNSS